MPYDTHYNRIFGVGITQLQQYCWNSAVMKLILVVEHHGRLQCRKLQSKIPNLRQKIGRYIEVNNNNLQ